VDIRGYWSRLHALLALGVEEGFMKAANLGLISNVGSVREVLAGIRAYVPPTSDKWVDLEQT
jgi:predicted Rossmann-fold nucleotide-binding protein